MNVVVLHFTIVYILSNLPTKSAAQDFQRDDRTASAIFIVDYNKTLSVASLSVYNVSDVFECSWKCTQHFDCWSFNFASKKVQNLFGCNLLSTDKYRTPLQFKGSSQHHHYSIESPCQETPCKIGGTCQPLYDTDEYKCNCAVNSMGKNCEILKLNTAGSVCFSAKDNAYGQFNVTIAGKIKSFKLVHVSGKVGAWQSASGNWGTADSRIDTIITNNANQVLTPPTTSLNAYYSYTLPGVTANDIELNLPGFNTSLSVTAGQQFRIWFGEDLIDSTEFDNHGTSCTDVYALYE